MPPTRFDRSLLSALARTVSAAGQPQSSAIPLGMFAAARGHLATGELMVVGRAPNGWGRIRFLAGQLMDDLHLGKIVGEALAGVGWVNSGPMNEVRHSAFWRVCRDVSIDLLGRVPSDATWSSRLIWSNIYKIAPHDAGNPSERLQAVQRDASRRLLFAEFEQWRPRRVLFLTGWDWAKDSLDGLEVCGPFPRPSRVQAIRRLPHGGLAVVVPHPQGKREDQIRQGAVHAFKADQR